MVTNAYEEKDRENRTRIIGKAGRWEGRRLDKNLKIHWKRAV
jgi:hypothetical protein